MSDEKFYDRQVVSTGDGSASIFLPGLNEHYHSHHGAVQESKHVFMKMGWEEAIRGKSSVEILEIGFGTGLNAYLVLNAGPGVQAPAVHYTALEAFPVEAEMVQQLDYAKAGVQTEQENKALFLALHTAAWNRPVKISSGFTLEKLQQEVQEFTPQRQYDLIFFDAFAPRVQPELWTKEIFDKMFALLNPGGILVTYCSKGEVRRNMIAAGFSVEKVPGPPGKREMLRARRQ
jgi:tRNA U34 5-methylaminomethyl-2-thiouridine-forming methyltransferase MnmC